MAEHIQHINPKAFAIQIALDVVSNPAFHSALANYIKGDSTIYLLETDIGEAIEASQVRLMFGDSLKVPMFNHKPKFTFIERLQIAFRFLFLK